VVSVLSPTDLAGRLRRDVERSILRTRHGIKHLAGIDRAPVGQTPRDLVWQRDKVTLSRYRSDQRRYRPPVRLVMSLVTRSYIFDLRPGSSFVEVLLAQGLDVYLLDWGVPDEVDAHNGLETYTDEYLPRAAAAACAESDSEDLTVFGYCYGGVLSLLYVAGHPGPPVRNLAVMATPIDFTRMGPMVTMVQEGRLGPDDLVDETGNVPADAVANSFRLLKPTADLSGYANLWQNLWDDAYVEAYQTMTRWSNEHIPFPGAAMRQTVELLVRDNALLSGTVPLADGPRRLADITCPFLTVAGEKDHICPLEAVGPLIDLVGSEDRTEMRLPAGHVGLIVGRNASARTMPAMAGWIAERSGPAVDGSDGSDG
jgi:polyhydroxyalkanoate synthase subunit PhaC